MGDSLSRTPLNHRAKFDTAIALSSPEKSVTEQTHKKQTETVNDISTPCLSAWETGKPLTWDVTVVCQLADSYVASAAREAGTAAEAAASRKSAKYRDIESSHRRWVQ